MRWPILFLCLLAAEALPAAEPTALAALKLIPKERAAKLARIVGREGAPNPDRWYLIVHDPGDENGVHEFVVANSEVVASRAISQFAEKLSIADVVGGSTVKIDSDRLAKLARQYAEANHTVIAKMNYELKKESVEATPTWSISCFDENNQSIGELVVTASKGNVLSHPGFALVPAPPVIEKKPVRAIPVFPSDSPVERTAATPMPESTPLLMDNDRRTNPVGDTFKNMGRGIRRLVPF